MITFFFKVLSIAEISRPPSLNIFGLFLISIIVDSRPTDDFPPSSTYFTLFPKSSLTSLELTALTFENGLALGAANGKSSFFNKFLVTGCLGNLTAKVFFLLVTILEIFEKGYKLKDKVIKPAKVKVAKSDKEAPKEGSEKESNKDKTLKVDFKA